MTYKHINEAFNSKLIKDIFNDTDILKYHDKSVNISSADKLLDLDIVKNTNIKEDTIYKQLRGCLCNLYMQYIELLNKDIANDIYDKVDKSPLNIFSVINKLKKYGIDKEIINNENIVLPIIKNIQNYLKRLDTLINKLITGNFNNTIKDTALISLTNVSDEDIEEIPFTKLKRKLSEKIYNKINNDNYFLVIRTPTKNTIAGKISNTIYYNTNISLSDYVVIYSYNNMGDDYLFNQAISYLQTEWNYCKDNLEYLNINGYEIPYYEQKYINPVIEKIYQVFTQSNNVSSTVCYDVKSFQKKLKMYIGTGIENPKIYLINTHGANIKKHEGSTKTEYTNYNKSRHNTTSDDYQSIIKKELRDKLKYIIDKFKILNINNNDMSILVDISKTINTLQLVYTMEFNNKPTNFSFLMKYSKFNKFLCNILYPYISDIYNIIKQNTVPRYKLDEYLNKLNTYNLYLSKYRKIIVDSTI